MYMKNKYIVTGEVVTIELSKGYSTKIDLVDFPLISQRSWLAVYQKHSGYVYAQASTSTKINRKKVSINFRMSRYILNVTDPKIEVDHIDGDSLNNTRNNLRLCTKGQNMSNLRKIRKSSSRFKGVTFSKSKNKWKSQMSHNDKNRHIGYFDSEIEAAIAFNWEALKWRGSFAKLNSI
jgi:hypothetical protein